MLRLCLALSLVLLLAGSALPARRSYVVNAAPIALDPGDPARRELGELRYLGGWVLTSNDPEFGGLSSLSVTGTGILALSDLGRFTRFGFAEAGGQLRIGPPHSWPLRDAAGRIGERKIDRDSESMAIDPVHGTAWVGLETINAIYRLAPPLLRAEAEARPAGMREWRINLGAEAMVRLRDGRFLVIAEKDNGPDGGTDALLFDRDPTDPAAHAVRFGYRPPAGFDPTDAAELPDGRVVLLNRRFSLLSGLAAAVTVIDPAAIRADHAITGREIARLEPPLSVDNMEGISVTQESGRIILWMISDDNFSPVERTLLLKFALAPAAAE